MDENHTIVGLRVNNIMRIRAVEVAPEPTGAVVVGGQNGQGKTSLLNAIMFALGGGKKIEGRALRKGSSKGNVVVDLGDYTVERRFVQDGADIGTVEIRAKDGSKIARPQELLDRIAGKLTFDPTEFIRMDSAEQGDLLRKLAGVDIAEIKARQAQLDVDRHGANLAMKSERVALDRMASIGSVIPADEGIVIADEEARIQTIRTRLAERDVAIREYGAANMANLNNANKAGDLIAEIERLEKLIAQRREELEMISAKAKGLADAVAAAAAKRDAIDVPDPGEINSRINRARVRDAALEGKRKLDEHATNTAEAEKKWRDLDAKLQDARDEEKRALAEAHYPIEGLCVDESGNVIYLGLPFRNASSSEQLRVSLAISMALNPTLRVIFVRNGNDLDLKNLEAVTEVARSSGYQLWIERVAEAGDEHVTILIEDGRVLEEAEKKGKD